MMEQPIVILEQIMSFPYNSEPDSTGLDDRLYDAQDWADYFRQFIGNGVFPNPANGLKVESLYDSMVLTVNPGAAFAVGRCYLQKQAFEFSVLPAHLTLNRFDVVVCRADNLNRIMQILYISGDADTNPQIPELVRNDDIFDIRLCEFLVPANAQNILSSNILDTRLDNAVCGIVHGVVDQVDTTEIFNQYQDYLNQQITYWDDTETGQASDWQAQMTQQADDFQTIHDDMVLQYQAMQSGTWALINNNYDDWSVKRGSREVTEFSSDGTNIHSSITIIADNFLLAEKDTVFSADGTEIDTTITFHQYTINEGAKQIDTADFTISRHIVFSPDGSIITTEVL